MLSFRAVVSLPCLAGVLFVAACSKSPAPEPAADPLAAPDQTYVGVKGRVVSLPGDGVPPTDLVIAHEDIPGFVGRDGNVHQNADGTAGMKAMQMPFPDLAPGLSLEGLQPGDPIQFTFAVKWTKTGVLYRVTDIAEMPGETPPAPTQPAPTQPASTQP